VRTGIAAPLSNIAFLADYYTPHEIGGAERSAHRLAVELARTGVEVLVATPNYGAPADERIDGVHIVRLAFPERIDPGQLAKRRWLSNPFVHGFYAVLLARLLRDSGANVLHVQNSGLVVGGVLAARLAHVPAVVTIRDLGYLEPDESSRVPGAQSRSLTWALDAQWARVERRAKRKALSRAAEIVFVSQALRTVYAQSNFAKAAARGRVVYNIGPEQRPQTSAARDAMTVLFVGKMSVGKGLDVLYRAAERVHTALPAVRFVLVGSPGVGFTPPPEKVASRFSLAGRLQEQEVAGLMSRASVLVSPSVWPEPLSRVLLESMAAELPVVATTAGGTPEALEHGKSALLVPPGDADALAGALVRVLTDRPCAVALAAEARRQFEQRFAPGAILPQMIEVYEHARANLVGCVLDTSR